MMGKFIVSLPFLQVLEVGCKHKRLKRLPEDAIQQSTTAVDASSEAKELEFVKDEQIAEILESRAEPSAEGYDTDLIIDILHGLAEKIPGYMTSVV
ncbi:MAG: hypothetical protein Q9218_003173 [Villophora microphyllina]